MAFPFQVFPRFPLGRVFTTPGVNELLDDAKMLDLVDLLRRHSQCDWGDLDEEDKKTNDDAMTFGGRLFSTYTLFEKKVYCITEADRSLTTVLLPEEY